MAAQPGAALDVQRSVRYPAPLHVGPRWGRGSPGRAKSQRGNVIYSPAPSHQERGTGNRGGGKHRAPLKVASEVQRWHQVFSGRISFLSV